MDDTKSLGHRIKTTGIKYVCFDANGTIFDDVGIGLESCNRLLEYYGVRYLFANRIWKASNCQGRGEVSSPASFLFVLGQFFLSQHYCVVWCV
jgi:hypothetical protein